MNEIKPPRGRLYQLPSNVAMFELGERHGLSNYHMILIFEACITAANSLYANPEGVVHLSDLVKVITEVAPELKPSVEQFIVIGNEIAMTYVDVLAKADLIGTPIFVTNCSSIAVIAEVII